MARTRKKAQEFVIDEQPKIDVHSRLIKLEEKPFYKVIVESPDGGSPTPLFISEEELLIVSSRTDRSKSDFGESDL